MTHEGKKEEKIKLNIAALQDGLDGHLDEDGDDSLDALLQHWDDRPGKHAVPSWKAILKNTEICLRCGKKVSFCILHYLRTIQLSIILPSVRLI